MPSSLYRQRPTLLHWRIQSIQSRLPTVLIPLTLSNAQSRASSPRINFGGTKVLLLPSCTASPRFPQVHHPPTSNRQVMDSHRCFRNQGGLGATLYVTRNDHLHLAGFFSAKPRKHQVTWLPCEIEALCIAAAVKHFSPFIIQAPCLYLNRQQTLRPGHYQTM